jgi:DNA mismatch repair protein MutS2
LKITLEDTHYIQISELISYSYHIEIKGAVCFTASFYAYLHLYMEANMNSKTLEKLGYIEFKEQLKTYCTSDLGKQIVEDLTPISNIKKIEQQLLETTEALNILNTIGTPPFLGTVHITSIIKKLEKGIILDVSDLIYISDFFRGCKKLADFMNKQSYTSTQVSMYAQSMYFFDELISEINRTIKNNDIDDYASNRLSKVRKHKRDFENKIKDKLNKFINSNSQYVQESYIVERENHYLVPIKSSFKNQISGSVIDTSSKGNTVFIEPNIILKDTAELHKLVMEEADIEYQILATLSGLIMEQLSHIQMNIDVISLYDFIFAKAKYSKVYQGIAPKINNMGVTKLREGRHPFLMENAVPLDFDIGTDYRTLIITGPNAGGKTIVLKTIGLFTLATMSGLHIPARSDSEIAIYNQIFADIGDNQSIENALSTFSSHLKNLSYIMDKANNHTLLLLDEIGNGTEPNEGAALAIAMLNEFYKSGCITVSTTHYGEIKDYSNQHPGFMNAAMAFNKESLEPLYQLLIGTSGDSNAIWLAHKMNLKHSVIEQAKKYIAGAPYQFDEIPQKLLPKNEMTQNHSVNVSVETYKRGDRVKLLDKNELAVVYDGINTVGDVTVLYKNEFKKVNQKRLRLKVRAKDLYPEGYDMNQLFQSYEQRKLDYDLNRGSKKAWKKFNKRNK